MCTYRSLSVNLLHLPPGSSIQITYTCVSINLRLAHKKQTKNNFSLKLIKFMLNIISGDESWVSNYNQVIAIVCWNAAHSKRAFCFFGHINTIVPLPSALLGRFGSYNFALFSKLKFKLNARCSDTLEVIQHTVQMLTCSGQNRTSREYHKNVSAATGMSCNI